MADEITGLTGTSNNYSLLFLYTITTPIKINTVNVVDTPSSDLPSIAATVLTAQEKADLDIGILAFEVVQLGGISGASGAELLVLARSMYVTSETAYLKKYADKYKYSGSRFNK